MFHPKGPTFFELARQALSSTRRGYDLLAPKFDYTPFRTPKSVLEVVAKELERMGPVAAGIDICCGTGAGVEILIPICTQRVVGIDFSEGMLETAKSQVTPKGDLPQLQWHHDDVLQMPFENEFDIAVLFGANGHFLKHEREKLVQQIAKVLRPGGKFVFVTSYMPSVFSPSYWMARGFNAAMRIRNLLIRSPFIMYYLTFLVPETVELLKANEFEVEELSPFAGRLSPLRIIVGTRV